MQLSGNTILITGGSAGIGLAFAERFLKAGNTVIVCGRQEAKLQEAKLTYPDLHTRVCDVASEDERLALVEWAKREFPELNVLVNNAGIQQRTNLVQTQESWSYHHQEIAANLEAPLHLTMLFLPHLAEKSHAAVINVSSGLAFTPMAAAPIYCATKAALHSFTMSLRYQLASTAIEVIEVAPPAVNTDLGGKGLHTFGVPLDEFADGVFQGLEKGLPEIGYGTSEKALRLSRDEIDAAVQAINSRVSF
ncbi:SDR family oxidoreductase [Paenibacillus aestuarii]|uniref:SDR family oxidoreductase n=1 Tax=Paenibacillus aestuarii TaxID=516965 RepID=A0ABW0KF89_9BACL|nr:SDR family oxidoreductase [Paenibacillus aestuarii]